MKIYLPTIEHFNGNITVIEGQVDVPFDIKRVYFLHNLATDAVRGCHAHKALRQLIFAPSGSVRVKLNDGKNWSEHWLMSPNSALLIEPMTWRELDSFDEGSVVMVLASERFDENDYIRDFSHFFKSNRNSK